MLQGDGSNFAYIIENELLYNGVIMTQETRVLNALTEGKQFSVKQLKSMFKIGAPRAVIHRLRCEGNAIYLNKHVDTKGRVTNKYRLGTPSRAMVAAAAQAGARVFG